MKKLLSLLSVLTISGTAVPTTIAASPPKEETKLENNEISYLQTNNLKNLNRVKRQEITYPTLEDVLIDLRKTSMKKPMQFQITDSWCVIAILKNIFDNNILNNKDLKEMEQEEIASLFPNNANNGVRMLEIIELLKSNPIIKENLGFNLKLINLNRLFWNRLNDIEKKMWIRHLIWESLSRQAPVMFGGLFDKEYFGERCDNPPFHTALIVGIKPNKENILEDTYYVRDPWRDSEAEFIPDQTTEISMTGEQIFNILFNKTIKGEVLMHEDVVQLFCEKAIGFFLSIWKMAEPELMSAIV